MKIAITGSTGGIGRFLVDAISENTIHLLGRSREKLREVFVPSENRMLIETDYSPDSLKLALEGVTTVIHLAAVRPKSGLIRFSDYSDNIEISINLFHICQEMGIENFIFASSGSVYNPAVNPLPFDEDQPVMPITFYAKSKRMVEYLGETYGMKMKSLRFARVISLYERKEYMRMAFIYNALEKKPLVVHGCGTGAHEYIYIKDVVAAIMAAVRRPDISGVFNIGMGTAISNHQYAMVANEIFADNRSEIVLDNTHAADSKRYVMSGRKAANLLGFKPIYPLEAAFREMRDCLSRESGE